MNFLTMRKCLDSSDDESDDDIIQRHVAIDTLDPKDIVSGKDAVIDEEESVLTPAWIRYMPRPPWSNKDKSTDTTEDYLPTAIIPPPPMPNSRSFSPLVTSSTGNFSSSISGCRGKASRKHTRRSHSFQYNPYSNSKPLNRRPTFVVEASTLFPSLSVKEKSEV